MRYTVRVPLRIQLAGTGLDFLDSTDGSGALLSAAIARYVRGYIARPNASATGILRTLRGDRSYLSYASDVPRDADLGASTAETVAWATLTRSSMANTADRDELAKISCEIQPNLGILRSKGDAYAVALGGFTCVTLDREVHAERIVLSTPTTEALLGRLVLVHLGQRVLLDAVVEEMRDRYRVGERGVVDAVSASGRVAREMMEALVHGHLDAFGSLVDESWAAHRALLPAGASADADAAIELGRSFGALAGKACGLGCGSAILFTRPGCAEDLRRAFGAHGFSTIDFSFDTYGVFLSKG